MLSQGLLNKQIAYELSVSEATVKAHVSAILQKLGVESRTQAVILAGKIERVQDLTGGAVSSGAERELFEAEERRKHRDPGAEGDEDRQGLRRGRDAEPAERQAPSASA